MVINAFFKATFPIPIGHCLLPFLLVIVILKKIVSQAYSFHQKPIKRISKCSHAAGLLEKIGINTRLKLLWFISRKVFISVPDYLVCNNI